MDTVKVTFEVTLVVNTTLEEEELKKMWKKRIEYWGVNILDFSFTEYIAGL